MVTAQFSGKESLTHFQRKEVPLHYCSEHQTKFYRNEKADQNGEIKVWYSHKLASGEGFCNESKVLALPNDQANQSSSEVDRRQMVLFNNNPSQKMLMCNAMNNAVALATADKIKLEQIGQYYQRILSELNSTLD